MHSTSESAGTQLSPVDDVLEQLGTRLQSAIRQLGLSQTDVCKRVGVSTGFLSDVIRCRKRPGAELLLELRRHIGISLDWLITGEGSMFSSDVLNHERLRAIRLQTEIAKAAEIDGDPVAKEFVDYVLQNRNWPLLHEPRFAALLTRMSASESEDLAIRLYNVHSGHTDEIAQMQDALREAVRHFRVSSPSDPVSAYISSAVPPAARTKMKRQPVHKST